MTNYDLIVIGGGPAGEKGAVAAAYFDKRVALIERSLDGPGGATVHTGTLPSKTLRETALYITGFNKRELYSGVSFSFDRSQRSAHDLTQRLGPIRAQQTRQISVNLERHGVELISGLAAFEDPHHIRVGDQVLRADHFLIATGSSPRRPEAFDFNDPEVFDSDTLLKINQLPESLAVIGGGVIGSEYACVFAALGVKIEVIEAGPRLLSFLDEEVSFTLMNAMRASGIDLHLNDTVERLERRGPDLVLTLKSGKTEVVDKALVSAGRTGNTPTLNLEPAGVKTDPRGLILVDPAYCTSQPHIYAAGDVIGRPALASTAMEQGRMAVAHMFSLSFPPRDWSTVPSGIYTIPEACACGPTEQELIALAIPYVVGRSAMRHNARGQIIGDTEGFVKLLFHRETRRLLAVHLVCELATELIQIGQAVMRLGGGIDYFLETVMAYPSLSEAYKMAAYDALGALEPKRRRPTPLT